MVFVIKADGSKEEFSEKKLVASITRAGIPQALIPEVLAHIHSKLHENIHTSEIYHHILEFLDTSEQPFHKTKYSLKQSIMDLGPTGFPFEKFLAHLFERMGYQTKVDQILQGKCITHEVDIVIQKAGTISMVEAKFHNGVGIKTDVHVALYTKARFDDVSARTHFDKAFLVTNTKTTLDAITYAQCVDMEIMSWSYPDGNGLRDLIERYHLHPITSLSSLSQLQKQQLLEQDVVLCSELLEKKGILLSLHLTKEKEAHVLQEAAFASHS